MPIDANLLDLLPHSVTIKAFSSYNSQGEPSFAATGTAYACRISGRVRLVRDALGREVVSTKTILLDRAPGVSPKDQITLPDGRTPPILAVAAVPDEDGSYYEAIYV